MPHSKDISFLGLAFDWYILKWESSTPIEESPERRQKHIELGLAYAALGHEGRRLYVLRAFNWRHGDRNTDNLSRNLDEVPRDLLNASERRLKLHDPIWIRTNYGPGTDSRFEELVKGHEGFSCLVFDIMNDSERYELTDHDERAVFAYFPGLLESVDPEYLDEDIPFDSAVVQGRLFGEQWEHEMGIAEEDLHGSTQTSFFLADSEAMLTGYVRWVIPDQCGAPLLNERVQSWSLQDLQFSEYTLAEYRSNVSKDYYGAQQKKYGYFVEPWTPPS